MCVYIYREDMVPQSLNVSHILNIDQYCKSVNLAVL
jgi:hypothetical protein